jgi:3-oxoacyl-[acyl-carrier-protein] synthase III
VVYAKEPPEDAMLGCAVAGDTPAVEMALTATREALTRWGRSTDELALLLSAEVNPSGPDGWLQHSYLQRYAVGGHVLAAGIRQGCNGVFGALELAAAYLEAQAEPKAAVITAAENHDSSLLDRWTALEDYCMGDGASALVISKSPGFARLRSVASATVAELEEMHRGNEPLHPASVLSGRRTSFRDRGDAFGVTGKFTTELVGQLIETMGDLTTRILDEAGIKQRDVTRLVVFNGPWKDLEAYATAIGVQREQTTWEWGRSIGHSANDHLFALDHLLTQRELKAGDHLLLIGVGPGLNLATAVIEIMDQPQWLH